MKRFSFCLLLGFASVLSIFAEGLDLGANPLFITSITETSNGVALASKDGKWVKIFDKNFSSVIKSWEFDTSAMAVATSKEHLFVSTADNKLWAINLETGDKKSTNTASGPNFLVANGSSVWVLEQWQGTVSEYSMEDLSLKQSVKVIREPKAGVFSKDGKYLFIANFIPATASNMDYVAADVSVIDVSAGQVVTNIKLANGSNALRGITISEDGKYVFVSHNMGRFAVPATQLLQGWMNTSAMSVIDVNNLKYVGAVILDEPERGAAGIWDIKSVGGKIFISHSGTHDISIVDYKSFTEKLESYPGDVEALAYDLRFMYGLRKRVPLEGNGPRNIAIVGDKIVAPMYFSDTIDILGIESEEVESVVPLVVNRQETDAQKGEKIFNDATHCFQNWQSCNGCHPGDARNDGMNWDQMNDGIGNSKNCKSLLFSIQTPPSMISGIRETAQLANRKGFFHVQFYDIPEELAKCVDAYTTSLKPVPSPYLVDGHLSEKAMAGEKVFERLKCSECHNGPYFTDKQMHRIGEDIEFENGWDTPTLREVWRTAPYLFDGRAETLKDVFLKFRHGLDGKKVPEKDIDLLVEYVQSL